MEVVIFIESNTSGTGEIFIKKTIEYGFHPVFMTCNPKLYPFLYRGNEIEVVTIDTLDREEIISYCTGLMNKGMNIRGVLSTSEYYLQIAAAVADYFKLPGANERAIKNCRNKFTQYKILNEYGANVPKTKLIESKEQIQDELSKTNFPVIIKPIAGSGSVGVRLCSNYEESYDLINKLLLDKKNERGIDIDNRVLIEEFIQGEEYSGEVFNGKLIGITKKHLSELPFFIESGHDFPCKFEEKQYTKIESSICEAVGALNLCWGACHVEFRLLKSKVFFIEINPRLAGGYIPEIVRRSTGIDLIENQLKLSLNLPIDLKSNSNNQIGIRFIIPEEEGYIVSFAEKIDKFGIIEVKEYKQEGALFQKNGDFRDRVGHIIFNLDLITREEIDTIIHKLQVLKGDKS